ncbi:hypothetical protein [Seonamhaeicola aphaedonensis]|uniref:CDP-glycerol:poly(Glycerophosphate) glycerophosphotransferase n=1 Tax=Seonamhaeicola aphaedonensis TaxID=1461338 RepID=A0A3D9HFW2_9FLAO|nr:hypothetical protein [Seonamhaeicola aphaedonensis]RED48368.1 hypothetical protein DFQ02_104214 [Seonamhaeicola aphaedonensis]
MTVGLAYKKKVNSIWRKWLKVEHSGLNIGRLMANEIFYVCHYDSKLRKRSKDKTYTLILRLLKAVIFTKIETPFDFNSTFKDIFFLHQEDNRKDYQEQCNYVLKQLKNYPFTEIFVNKDKVLKEKIKPVQSFKKVGLLTKLMFYTFSSSSNYDSHGAYHNLKFYRNSLLYYDYYLYLFKVLKEAKIKILITFCDAKEYANLFTQAAINLKAVTVTQQHALYIGMNDSSYSQPVLNYRNLISDYFMAWGKSINEQWNGVGFDFTKIVYSGTNLPKGIDIQEKKGFYMPKKNVFGVILSAEYWRKSNIEMLEIAHKFSQENSYEFQVLFHPSNKIFEYIDIINYINENQCFQNLKNLDDFIMEKRFILCHTTSLYLRSLINKRKCFRFKDDNFIDVGGMPDDIFESKADFEMKFKNGLEYSNIELNEISSIIASHYGEENMNYINALETILKKERISINRS